MAWTIEGKTVLLTGGTTGIGRAAAAELARRGAKVTITSRDPDAARSAARNLSTETGGSVDSAAALDLADQDSVRAFADEYGSAHPQLDVLINNAGGLVGSQRETSDGIEKTMAINYLGPFLLTNLLIPNLEAAAPSRIINVSSDAYNGQRRRLEPTDLRPKGSYSAMGAYSASKMAVMLFTLELRRRFESKGITAVALHPGVVRTRFGSGPEGSRLASIAFKLAGPLLASPEKGSRTTVQLATAQPEDLTGSWYYSVGKPTAPNALASDEDAARRLWEESDHLVGLDAH